MPGSGNSLYGGDSSSLNDEPDSSNLAEMEMLVGEIEDQITGTIEDNDQNDECSINDDTGQDEDGNQISSSASLSQQHSDWNVALPSQAADTFGESSESNFYGDQAVASGFYGNNPVHQFLQAAPEANNLQQIQQPNPIDSAALLQAIQASLTQQPQSQSPALQANLLQQVLAGTTHPSTTQTPQYTYLLGQPLLFLSQAAALQSFLVSAGLQSLMTAGPSNNNIIGLQYPPNMYAQAPGIQLTQPTVSALPTSPPNLSTAETGEQQPASESNTNPSVPVAAASSTRPEPAAAAAAAAQAKRRYRHEGFPYKLHRLIREAQADGKSSIVRFTDDGKRFQILNKDGFEKEILPKYFRHNKIDSFTRLLHMYGFRRIQGTWQEGTYEHDLFRRDEPELCKDIVRFDRGFGSFY